MAKKVTEEKREENEGTEMKKGLVREKQEVVSRRVE